MNEFLSYIGAAAVIGAMIFLMCVWPSSFAIFLVAGIIGAKAMFLD